MKIYMFLIILICSCLLNCDKDPSEQTVQEQLDAQPSVMNQPEEPTLQEQLDAQIVRTDSLERVFENKKQELEALEQRVQNQENKQVTPL